MKLTVKQENFCNYYMETGNASDAYRRAYNAVNMKSETVNVKASELLADGKVAVRVNELQKELKDRSDITKTEAIKELTNIVRSRVTNVLNAKGKTVTIKSLSELPDEVIACISSIKSVKGGIEVKFYDKISAIDRLSKLLGWDSPQETDIRFTNDLNGWSDEQLAKFVSETVENLKTK